MFRAFQYRRLAGVTLVIGALFCFVLVRLFILQIWRHDELSAKSRLPIKQMRHSLAEALSVSDNCRHLSTSRGVRDVT